MRRPPSSSGLALGDASAASTSALAGSLTLEAGLGRERPAEDLAVADADADADGGAALRDCAVTAGGEDDPGEEEEAADGHEDATGGGLEVHG